MAAPHSATTMPSSSGKLADSPKLTSAVGTSGVPTLPGYRLVEVGERRRSGGTGHGVHKHPFGGTGRGGLTAPPLAGRVAGRRALGGDVRGGGHRRAVAERAGAEVDGQRQHPDHRNRFVRGVPSGSVTVTWTDRPMRAPAARMVPAPSAISPSPKGSRPSAADSSTGPRTGVTAAARTLILLTVIAGTLTSVTRSIAGSRASAASRPGLVGRAGPRPLTNAWNGDP